MVVFDKSNHPEFYVGELSPIEVSIDGHELLIEGFFLVGSVSRYYSILAGIGRDNEKTYLIGRALSSGINQEGKNRSYRCIEIDDYYNELVRAELECYKNEKGLTADIRLWKEISNHNQPEQTQELPSMQLTFGALEKELALSSLK